jgi:hypothetical protein
VNDEKSGVPMLVAKLLLHSEVGLIGLGGKGVGGGGKRTLSLLNDGEGVDRFDNGDDDEDTIARC